MREQAETYVMPDGSVTVLFAIPSMVKDPVTGKTWWADLESSQREAREVRKIGRRVPDA